jgi:hypothetical protein
MNLIDELEAAMQKEIAGIFGDKPVIAYELRVKNPETLEWSEWRGINVHQYALYNEPLLPNQSPGWDKETRKVEIETATA